MLELTYADCNTNSTNSGNKIVIFVTEILLVVLRWVIRDYAPLCEVVEIRLHLDQQIISIVTSCRRSKHLNVNFYLNKSCFYEFQINRIISVLFVFLFYKKGLKGKDCSLSLIWCLLIFFGDTLNFLSLS